jgi:hypothetical protein
MNVNVNESSEACVMQPEDRILDYLGQALMNGNLGIDEIVDAGVALTTAYIGAFNRIASDFDHGCSGCQTPDMGNSIPSQPEQPASEGVAPAAEPTPQADAVDVVADVPAVDSGTAVEPAVQPVAPVVAPVFTDTVTLATASAAPVAPTTPVVAPTPVDATPALAVAPGVVPSADVVNAVAATPAPTVALADAAAAPVGAVQAPVAQ